MDTVTNAKPNLFDMKSASEFLGISYSSMWRLVSAGKIGYFQIGGKRFFSKESLQSYLESVFVPPDIKTTGIQRRVKRLVKIGPDLECEI